MRLEVKVEVDDFMDNWSGDSLDELIHNEIKSEVLKKLKVSEEYKAFINKQLEISLSKLVKPTAILKVGEV